MASQSLDERAARSLSWALQQHCCRRTYQATVVGGAMRINLQGEPVEPVTPEGQAHAQQRIDRILAARARGKPQMARVKASKQPIESPVKAPTMPTVIVKKRRMVVIPSE